MKFRASVVVHCVKLAARLQTLVGVCANGPEKATGPSAGAPEPMREAEMGYLFLISWYWPSWSMESESEARCSLSSLTPGNLTFK